MSQQLEPIAGHFLRVSRGPVRAYVDCDCPNPPQTVHASMRAAERTALRHYVECAPPGDERDRAARLLDQSVDGTLIGASPDPSEGVATT